MQINAKKSVISVPLIHALRICLVLCLVAAGTANESSAPGEQQPQQSNSIDNDNQFSVSENYKHVACGTIVSNLTNILVKNPHHPEPTYVKTICETVVERADQAVKKLNIKFKHFDLYRPTYDGTCLHDRFGVYNDLNVAVTPVLCGVQTGNNLSVPFIPPQTSLIVSIATSDLDHDRYWMLEIEQER